MPCSAKFKRFLPSKLNGLVTIATVKAPWLFAISAITGEAPVPEPPPIPAAMNTILASLNILVNASRSSSAD